MFPRRLLPGGHPVLCVLLRGCEPIGLRRAWPLLYKRRVGSGKQSCDLGAGPLTGSCSGMETELCHLCSRLLNNCLVPLSLWFGEEWRLHIYLHLPSKVSRELLVS